MGQDYMQNSQSDFQTVARVSEGSLRAAAATITAFSKYLESRSRVDSGSALLANYIKQGGQLRCMTIDRTAAKDMAKLLEKENVTFSTCKVQQGDHTKMAILYGASEEQKVQGARETYLAANHKIFQVEKDTLRKFTGKEFEAKSGLPYDEMVHLKDRAIKNKLMFSAEKEEKNGTYTVSYRKEDANRMNVLYAGVCHEKNGIGAKIYAQEGFDRANRERVLNRVLVDKENNHLVGNGNGSQVMYITNEGIYYANHNASKTKEPYQEFVKAGSDQYERKLCEYMDRIKNPKCITGSRADALGEELKENILREKAEGEKVLSMQAALEKFHIKGMKELTQENINKELQKNPELIKERAGSEAYYMLQRATDLYRTKQEGMNRPNVTQMEKDLYAAENDCRIQYEFCINNGEAELKNAAEQYTSGDISVDEITSFTKEHPIDIRGSIVWKEPYTLPDYVDMDHDGIIDDFDLDVFGRDGRGEMPDMDMDSVEKE